MSFTKTDTFLLQVRGSCHHGECSLHGRATAGGQDGGSGCGRAGAQGRKPCFDTGTVRSAPQKFAACLHLWNVGNRCVFVCVCVRACVRACM
jgi:hypothetical protein